MSVVVVVLVLVVIVLLVLLALRAVRFFGGWWPLQQATTTLGSRLICLA